jgi:hypothetical protein
VAQHFRQSGEDTCQCQQPQGHGEEQHEGADVEGGGHGSGDRLGKGGGEPLCLEGGSGTSLTRFPGAVKAKDQPHDAGGSHVGEIKQDADPPALEHPRAYYPQDKGGTGIVAEGQQPLGLRPGALTLPV